LCMCKYENYNFQSYWHHHLLCWVESYKHVSTLSQLCLLGKGVAATEKSNYSQGL
jgi:hypothetical protein